MIFDLLRLTAGPGNQGAQGSGRSMNLMPFLLFDGNCAEAMAFYQSCVGGELTITRLGDTPMGTEAPPEQRHKVAYALLTGDSVELSGTDWMHPTRIPRQGNTVAVYLQADHYAELRAVFDRLAVGADQELLDDLRDMPFGTYGHLADRYGVHWFFRAAPREATSGDAWARDATERGDR